MARGFESKSVQEQWQDAEQRAEDRKKPKRSSEELERERKRESLEMTRRMISRELESTASELRRTSLRAALLDLDEQLKRS
jgi:hypothetical protein